MKALYLALALMLTVSAPAAHLRCRYRRARRPVPITRKVSKVPWKTIVAGGAAAGTVIAAYKVSNGMEQALKHRKPSLFGPVSCILLLAALSALALLAVRFCSLSPFISRLSRLVFRHKKERNSYETDLQK